MLTVNLDVTFEHRSGILSRPPATSETVSTTLRRLAELNGVKPQHDLDERRTLGRATLWGWCECGTVHDLAHDCPVCYAQQPETD